MPRTKQGQAAHDREVARIAAQYERRGFDVEADLPGRPKPQSIGGYVPDIVARKGMERKIVEVETQDSKDSARGEGQRKAFRAAADRSEDTTFRRVIVGS
jgi:hypothetical protein